MITLVVGKGNAKLKFAHTLSINCKNTLYFRSIDALRVWLNKNPTSKATIVMQVNDEFLKIVRQNKHLDFILVMDDLPNDDWLKYIDWIHFFDKSVSPFIKKYFTRDEIVSIPISNIQRLDRQKLELYSSVYDRWNDF